MLNSSLLNSALLGGDSAAAGTGHVGPDPLRSTVAEDRGPDPDRSTIAEDAP